MPQACIFAAQIRSRAVTGIGIGSRRGSYVAALPHFGWQSDLSAHCWINWAQSRFCRVNAVSLMYGDKPARSVEDDLEFGSGQDAEAYLEAKGAERGASRVLCPLYPQHLALRLEAFPAFFRFETSLFVSEPIATSRRGKPPLGIEISEPDACDVTLVP